MSRARKVKPPAQVPGTPRALTYYVEQEASKELLKRNCVLLMRRWAGDVDRVAQAMDLSVEQVHDLTTPTPATPAPVLLATPTQVPKRRRRRRSRTRTHEGEEND